MLFRFRSAQTGRMKIIRLADRVPKPRPEPTPADLLRELLAARAPKTDELRRRLKLNRT